MNKKILQDNILIVCMILFSLIVEIVGMLLVVKKLDFTLGIIFGLVFSILKLMLMKNTIKKALTMPEAKAQKYANGQYVIRYVLTGVVLVVAALLSTTLLLGTFFGLMSMKVAAYAQIGIQKREEKNREVN